MATRTLNGVALCAGVGTIELGLRLALGSAYRTVGYVERETFAASVLVARMAEQAMDAAPVWDDLATFDGGPWSGRVDIVTAGFPCQPFSQAGRRGGTDDDRWLWPHVHRIVDEMQPQLVFIENVPPIVKHGLDDILGGLAESGFDAEWGCLSAADVGATHIRQRLWLLAYRHGERRPIVRLTPEGSGHLANRQSSAHVADTSGERRQPLTRGEPPTQGSVTGRTALAGDVANRPIQDVADAESVAGGPGLRSGTAGSETEALQSDEPRDPRSVMADPERTRPQGSVHRIQEREQRPSLHRPRLPLWPPRPDDGPRWLDNANGPQPSVCRTSDGMANRLDRLHAIGNGVVPLVAATAFIRLARRAGLVDE